MEYDKKTLNTCGGMAIIALLMLIVAGAIILFFFNKVKDATPDIGINETTEVYMTPTQIQSIRDIGQWEFLAINTEEMVDTVRHGIFSDDYLVRIYYGTLRLGVDLSRIDDQQISTRGDTLILTVPNITLLDPRFIDEARTRSFHESGHWTGKDRNALYKRARRKMLIRNLTLANIVTARQIAENQLRQMLNAMGFQQVVIKFN